MSRSYPLIHHAPDQVIAWYKGSPVSAGEFLSDVLHTAEWLPRSAHVINLCDDRYHFMLGFAACLLQKQLTLLPPNATPGVINELVREYPDCICLTDKALDDLVIPQFQIARESVKPGNDCAVNSANRTG